MHQHQKIIEITAQVCGCTPEEITGKCRLEHITIAKHISRHIIKERLGASFATIATWYGCDPNAARNSYKRADYWKREHCFPAFNRSYAEVEKRLESLEQNTPVTVVPQSLA